MTGRSGLSLIELLTCLCIVAILGAIALPAYQSHVRRVRRLEAQHALLNLQSLQQRFLFDHGRYAVQFGELDGASDPSHSREGNYVLEMRGLAGGGWLAIAEPAPASDQREDAGCRSFSLDDAGRRGATGSADAPRRCW